MQEPTPSSSSSVGRRPWSSSLAAAADRQDDVSCLVPTLDVPMRLDDLFHRVSPVDDCPKLSRLDEPLHEDDILFDLATARELQPPVADAPRPQRPEQVPESVGRDVDPTR